MLCGEEENWGAGLLRQTPAFYSRHQVISHGLRGGSLSSLRGDKCQLLPDCDLSQMTKAAPN